MAAPRRIYAGTNDGLRSLTRASTDEGWTVHTQALDNAPVTAIRPVGDGSGDLWCGVGVWGVWKCSAEGHVTAEANNGLDLREVHGLAVSPGGVFAATAPPRVYAATDPLGGWSRVRAFESIPASARWNYPVPPNYPNVRQVVSDPANPRTLYVGVEIGGLYRSRDAGETWEDLTRDMDPDVHAIALHPERQRRIVTATPRGPFVSHDDGGSWTSCWNGRTPSYSASIAVCPAEPDAVIAGISRGFRGADCSIWISEDGAKNWKPATGDLGTLTGSQIRGALVYSEDSPRTAFAGSLAGELFESNDAGRTWHLVARGLPPIRALYAP